MNPKALSSLITEENQGRSEKWKNKIYKFFLQYCDAFDKEEADKQNKSYGKDNLGPEYLCTSDKI